MIGNFAGLDGEIHGFHYTHKLTYDEYRDSKDTTGPALKIGTFVVKIQDEKVLGLLKWFKEAFNMENTALIYIWRFISEYMIPSTSLKNIRSEHNFAVEKLIL